jgi:hypothetical protein
MPCASADGRRHEIAVAQYIDWFMTWCRSTRSSPGESGCMASRILQSSELGLSGPALHPHHAPQVVELEHDGHPVGNTWYAARCAVHEPTPTRLTREPAAWTADRWKRSRPRGDHVTKAVTIDDYIALAPEAGRSLLERLRALCHDAAPMRLSRSSGDTRPTSTRTE